MVKTATSLSSMIKWFTLSDNFCIDITYYISKVQSTMSYLFSILSILDLDLIKSNLLPQLQWMYDCNNIYSTLLIFFGKKNHLHFYKMYSPSAYIKYKIFEKTINQHG